MTQPSPTSDLRRALATAHEALALARTHLARHAEGAAALHCATDRVLYPPLHDKVAAAMRALEHVTIAYSDTPPAVVPDGTGPVPSFDHTLLADLDRCEHGRHAPDPCSSCPGGQSSGNHYLPTGMRVGTGRRTEPLVVPHHSVLRNPAAWRNSGAHLPAMPDTRPIDGTEGAL